MVRAPGLPVEPLDPTVPGVRLWACDLDAPDVDHLHATLSDDERARAASFRSPRDARRSATCRAVLRGLLGEAAGVEPAQIRFAVELGTTKPCVAWPDHGVVFNVSHSGHRALVGIASAGEVGALGVDVERVRADVDVDAMARRYFSPAEQRALSAIADAEARRLAYFACWTRKEAVVKGLGAGLGLRLRLFDVDVTTSRPAPVVSRDDAAMVEGWLVHPVDLGAGWKAAAATPALHRRQNGAVHRRPPHHG